MASVVSSIENNQVNEIFKAISDPKRRRILELLNGGSLCAGDISKHFSCTKPTVSSHLAVLKEVGLVDAEEKGNQRIYQLNRPVFEGAMMGFLGDFGMELAGNGS